MDLRGAKQFGSIHAVAFVLSLAIPHFGQVSAGIGAKVVLQKDTALIVTANSGGDALLVFEVEVRDRVRHPARDLVHSDFVIIERGQKQSVVFFRNEFATEGSDFQGKYLVAYYRFIKSGDSIKVQVKLKDEERVKRQGLQLSVIGARRVEVTL